MNASKLETWVWVLIYGGLLTVVLGLAVEGKDFPLGWSMVTTGGIAAALGVVLIFVRARLKP
ncbi:hypothetical protein [Aquabacterium sp.]|uniref:hypothetical protein n=1 Tax=Aquabacterium sp. TaxID=1872578 RepID=UPI00378447AB